MTNINIEIEEWEYKLLESFYSDPKKEIEKRIRKDIDLYKQSILDRFIEYHRSNNYAISYQNDEDLINKSYEIGIIRNLSELNNEFIENN
jgi:hypothetical protein